MAPTTIGNALLGRITPGTSSSVKLFDIRLNENPLVLRGSRDTASGVSLTGTLVLCLSEPLRSVQSVRLDFLGKKKMDFIADDFSYHKAEEEFMHHTWNFVPKRSADILSTNNYEWPFSLTIPGTVPESVEGLPNNWVIYRLKATIERVRTRKDEITRKNVRIVRTLASSDLESTLEMSVARVWRNKINYSINTPSKAVIFGNTVTVNFALAPALKGLVIEQVNTRLKEAQELNLVVKGRKAGASKKVRIIVEDKYSIPADMETQDCFTEGFPSEGYIFSRCIEIPKNLKECLQNVETMGFRIRHALEFNIQLRNPDGHVSEVNASLPIQIYISPFHPFGHNDCVGIGNNNVNLQAADVLAPPGYGDHQLDHLYGDIDRTGYDTPAPGTSGLATPLTPRNRSTSVEDLATIDGLALQHRLNALGIGDGSSPAADGSTQRPTPLSQNLPFRRTSDDEHVISSGLQTPLGPSHVEYSDQDLTRVPSYSTALESSSNVPLDGTLPTYQSAISTSEPSSPPQTDSRFP